MINLIFQPRAKIMRCLKSSYTRKQIETSVSESRFFSCETSFQISHNFSTRLKYLVYHPLNKRRIIADNFHVLYENLTDGKTTQSKTRVKKRTAEKNMTWWDRSLNVNIVRGCKMCLFPLNKAHLQYSTSWITLTMKT